jgi:hypothetical protein
MRNERVEGPGREVTEPKHYDLRSYPSGARKETADLSAAIRKAKEFN